MHHTPKHKSEQLTSDYYQQLITESQSIEKSLNSFVDTLNSSIFNLQIHTFSPKTFSIKEMQELRNRIWGMMDRVRYKIQRQVSMITEVTKTVGKVCTQFQQLIEVMKKQNDRSSYALLQLQNQLNLKQLEITQCDKVIDSQKDKLLQQKWKNSHYIHQTKNKTSQVNGLAYAKILKDIKIRLETQIDFEKRQQNIFTYNIQSKLKDFKAKLLNVWFLLPSFKKQQATFMPKHGDHIESIFGRELSELERQYIKKQKQIDQFELSKLDEIKRRLKMMEDVQISQSRQLSYSHSVDGHAEESQVVEVGQRNNQFFSN